jgi:hypothetical protein
MDHDRLRTLTRLALAATLLLPVACSSAPSGGSSGFQVTTTERGSSGTGSGTGSGSDGYGGGAVDSGTTSSLSEDSGTSDPVDSGTATTDSAVQPTADSSPPPASTFAGTFNCNLTFNYDISSPISTSGSQMSTGVLTTNENGTIVTADLSGDAGISCSIQFADEGSGMASLSPPSSQLCDVTAMGVSVEVDFTSGGTANLALPSLSANIPFQITDGPGGSLGISGSGSLTADCTKM